MGEVLDLLVAGPRQHTRLEGWSGAHWRSEEVAVTGLADRSLPTFGGKLCPRRRLVPPCQISIMGLYSNVILVSPMIVLAHPLRWAGRVSGRGGGGGTCSSRSSQNSRGDPRSKRQGLSHRPTFR